MLCVFRITKIEQPTGFTSPLRTQLPTAAHCSRPASMHSRASAPTNRCSLLLPLKDSKSFYMARRLFITKHAAFAVYHEPMRLSLAATSSDSHSTGARRSHPRISRGRRATSDGLAPNRRRSVSKTWTIYKFMTDIPIRSSHAKKFQKIPPFYFTSALLRILFSVC